MGEREGIVDALLEVARGLGIEHPLETAALFARWERIVGPQVAARARPVVLRRGVLTVEAATAAWAGEMRYLAPEVLRRVNANLGRPLVREVKVKVKVAGTGARTPASAERRGRLAPPAVPPSPGAAAREGEAIAAPIGDGRLADALKRAHLAAKTRKKES